MIFFRNLRERLRLLEYENKIIFKRISQIEKELPNGLPPIPLEPLIIREDGWDLSYETLKRRHREDV